MSSWADGSDIEQKNNKGNNKVSLYHFNNISRIKVVMSQQDAEKLLHVFIFSWRDYCKGAFTGQKVIKELQLIQNAPVQVLKIELPCCWNVPYK